jgi:hypothetical protein
MIGFRAEYIFTHGQNNSTLPRAPDSSTAFQNCARRGVERGKEE